MTERWGPGVMFDALSLGKLLDELRAAAPDNPVRFDDYTIPGWIGSYRGYYEDLAIDRLGKKPVTAGDLANQLTAMLGKYVEGYKGGHYLVRPRMGVWVSNHNIASGWGLVGVTRAVREVILDTRPIDT